MNGGAVQTGKPEWVWPHRSDKSQAFRSPIWVFYGQAQKRLLTKIGAFMWACEVKVLWGLHGLTHSMANKDFLWAISLWVALNPGSCCCAKYSIQTGRTVLTLASTFSHNPIHLGYISRCGWWYIPLEHSDSSWCKSKKRLHHLFFWVAWISGPQVMPIN